MARTVREIMNHELLSIRRHAPANDTLELILEFGITAVPVLDEDDRPIGVCALRDLVRSPPGEAPMTSPASTIDQGASIAAAAEVMAKTGRHHLVVVDADGHAIGMVSTLDVIRALLGEPVRHPASFPHRDAVLGVAWSHEEILDKAAAVEVPRAPGVLMLLRGGVERDEVAVWAEAAEDLRERAIALANRAAGESESLRAILADPRLRMRHCLVHDAAQRQTLAERLRDRFASAPPPGGT
jgi:CBS domain-containing protein